MRKSIIATLLLLCGLCLAATAMADPATKDECVAKSKEAAKFLLDKGVEAATAELNKKDGKFVWKDTYVFMMGLDGKMLAHPMSPALVGQSVLDKTDKSAKGKPIFKEFVELAKTKGEGWVDYMWPKPGVQDPAKKNTYIYRVPGKDLLMGAGIYE